MTLWNKIVLGAKFLFGGFEAATDYILMLVNELLGKDGVCESVQKVRDFLVTALSYLKKYEKYCPAIWADDYLKIKSIIQSLVDMFDDGKVSSEEINKMVETVQAAIDEWMK